MRVTKLPTHHARHGQAFLVEHVAAMEEHNAEGLSCIWTQGRKGRQLSAKPIRNFLTNPDGTSSGNLVFQHSTALGVLLYKCLPEEWCDQTRNTFYSHAAVRHMLLAWSPCQLLQLQTGDNLTANATILILNISTSMSSMPYS